MEEIESNQGKLNEKLHYKNTNLKLKKISCQK